MRPVGPVYRVARKPNPWAPIDWAYAADDKTFGNRYDDPEGEYRVLYASSQRLGCFIETLARFRVDPKLAAELMEISGDDDHYPLGEIPPEWLEQRCLGTASCVGEYADVCSAGWIGKLRTALARDLATYGFADLDASALQHANRPFTNRVSRLIYESGSNGIYYRSKHGHDLENWALFEPFAHLVPTAIEAIRHDDPAFEGALRLHALKLGPR